MTDTAIPIPEAEPYVIQGLTLEQTSRASALEVARNALVSRQGLFSGSNVNTWKVTDLLMVADWVLQGANPDAITMQLGQTTESKEPFDWDANPSIGSHDPADGGYPPERDDSGISRREVDEDDTPTQSIPTYDPKPER